MTIIVVLLELIVTNTNKKYVNISSNNDYCINYVLEIIISMFPIVFFIGGETTHHRCPMFSVFRLCNTVCNNFFYAFPRRNN